MRSRRDIQRLNAWMQHDAIMARALRTAFNGNGADRIVDLGGGDGGFLLHVARRLNGKWPKVNALLVDRVDVFDPEMRNRFGAIGWSVSAEVSDALDWLRNSSEDSPEVIISNLLLHQFEKDKLAELLCLASNSTSVLIALEPRRGFWPLLCSRFVGLLGCGAVTRFDAPVSVRAGFTGHELSALWPDAGNWELTERRIGLFTHFFRAVKTGRAAGLRPQIERRDHE